ncbi:lasso peptide biosynthesis B2 protein [Aurantiacibacter spongiae]|nr:lasso peptide biosynthesis B2 protein [Aurantiacibacter spongiae]
MRPFRTLRKVAFRAEIVGALAWARFLIRFVAMRRWSRLLGPIDGQALAVSAPPVSPAQAKQARDIGRIVRRTAARMPFRAVCLPQAMSARWLLRRRGIPSRIVIGSRRGDSREGLLFHAWLMVGEQVVTGQDERDAFIDFTRRGIPLDAR